MAYSTIENFACIDSIVQMIDIIPPRLIPNDTMNVTIYIPVNFQYNNGKPVMLSGKFINSSSTTTRGWIGIIGAGVGDGYAVWNPAADNTNLATMLNLPNSSGTSTTFWWVADSNNNLYLRVISNFIYGSSTLYTKFMGYMSNVTFGTPLTALSTVTSSYIKNGTYSYS
jgi:hypothetical protein